jgi:hypothetical protein
MKANNSSLSAVVVPAILLAALIPAASPAARAAESPGPAPDLPAEGREKVVTLERFEVAASVLASIGVNFTMNKLEPDDPAATIYWATVTDVPRGSSAQKAGFKPGDELIRLNDQVIRGLTIAQFLTLISQGRQRGDLVWKFRRGVLGTTYTAVFNGKPGSKWYH